MACQTNKMVHPEKGVLAHSCIAVQVALTHGQQVGFDSQTEK